MVNRNRQDVLTDQIENINNSYEKRRGKLLTSFGLLHGKRRYIDWKAYPHTDDPENKGLILVFFSDRILNLKAEEIKMKVLLHNSYQAIPFIVVG